MLRLEVCSRVRLPVLWGSGLRARGQLVPVAALSSHAAMQGGVGEVLSLQLSGEVLRVHDVTHLQSSFKSEMRFYSNKNSYLWEDYKPQDLT